MKNKKLVFPIIVLVVAMVAMAVFGVVSNIAQKPTVTEHDFPFSITYELNGVTETIDGVCQVSYTGNDGYVKATTRQYEGAFICEGKDIGTAFEILVGDEWSITMYTHIYPDYLMGDPEYDYFDDAVYEPLLAYSNWATGETVEGLELPEHDAKIISWEYPQPIENSFEFSHIAHMSAEVVFPFALIALLALLVIVIFVRRDKTRPLTVLDKVSIVFNFLNGFILLPFVSIYGVFIDINGSEAAFYHQLGYLVPAVTLLGLAASIALRRNGYRKSGFFVQFAGIAIFALHLLLSTIG